MGAFKSNWECKIVGILAKDREETNLDVQSLVFLSITIECCPGGWNLHQHEYLKNKLRERDIKNGRPALPEVEEGR